MKKKSLYKRIWKITRRILFFPYYLVRYVVRFIKKTYQQQKNIKYFKGKLAIWGWWEGKNLGDQWIKKCMKRIFPHAVFIEFKESQLNKAGFVICGGGGLWQSDVAKPFKQKLTVPFGTIGLGAEFPFPNDRAKELQKQSDFFFIRDQYSLDCMKIKDLKPSRDITFMYPLKWLNENEINIDDLFFVWRDGKDLKEMKLHNFVNYGEYLDNYKEFEDIIKSNFKNIKYDDFQTYEDDIESRINGFGFVISGRFHGIISAIQKGLPCIGIDICPKIRVLMQDCGLEDYCIKMNEVSKLDSLIKKAKTEIQSIREKQLKYLNEAINIIQKDVKFAQNQVGKYLLPYNLKGIHYGAYWMGKNDIINTISNDMSELCNLKKIDLKLYSKKRDQRVEKTIKFSLGYINFLNTNLLIKDINKYKPNFILLNSGGLTLNKNGFDYCKRKGVKVIGTELSDPDVFLYNGNLYADQFDIFYTNSKYSLNNQYDKSKVNIKLLPFGASTKHHFYKANIEKKYDVVVVGHAREDRKIIIEELKSNNIKVGLYGNGWGKEGLGVVYGEEQVNAINSGKIYLSFSTTIAGYENVKVGLFEAMACKSCVITQYMDELNDYFEIGKEVICYKNKEELIDLIKYYLSHSEELEKIREVSYNKFLSEHTYYKRAEKILVDIQNLQDKDNYFINNNLISAEKWLYTCCFNGLAQSYNIITNKWVKPYPEVTGYLLTYMCHNNYDEKKLIKIADNLLKYQNKNGGFPSFNMNETLFTFDTSQILIGLCKMYKKTNKKKYFNSAIKCGEFLIASQLENGAFIPIFNTKKQEFILDEKTYDIWNGPFSGLMCKLNEGYEALYDITCDLKYLKKIELTTSFYEKQPDIESTHPMGYFLEGLWAGGKFDLVKEKIQNLILPRLHKNGYIAYTEKSSFAYVSGTIQLGILMYKTGFIEDAKKVLNYARLVQSKSHCGGLFQYADKDGNLDKSIHTEINSWGTKYYCELERLLKNV